MHCLLQSAAASGRSPWWLGRLAGLLRLAPGGLAGDGWCLPWRPGLAARLPACAAARLPLSATAGPGAEGKGEVCSPMADVDGSDGKGRCPPSADKSDDESTIGGWLVPSKERPSVGRLMRWRRGIGDAGVPRVLRRLRCGRGREGG